MNKKQLIKLSKEKPCLNCPFKVQAEKKRNDIRDERTAELEEYFMARRNNIRKQEQERIKKILANHSSWIRNFQELLKEILQEQK